MIYVKRIYYEESYPIEEEITLSISGYIDKIEKNITFKVLSKGSYDIRVHVYAYSKKTNGYDGWCNKTLYFDCCE